MDFVFISIHKLIGIIHQSHSLQLTVQSYVFATSGSGACCHALPRMHCLQSQGANATAGTEGLRNTHPQMGQLAATAEP